MPGLPSKRIVATCPMCSGALAISRLACTRCDTTIDSTLPVPPLARLPEDVQQFALTFLKCRGNIREVERELGISYPTVCKRLDLLNTLLGQAEKPQGVPPKATTATELSPDHILHRLERGELSAREAANLLKRAHGGA